MTWYVVADQNTANPDEKVWTLNTHPDYTGWETDSSCPGYGLTKQVAEFLAAAANEKEARDGICINDGNGFGISSLNVEL